MSKKDKKMLGVAEDTYMTSEEAEYLVKRAVKKVNNIPVSFIDFSADANGVAVTIGTRSGKEYRNKGYATAVAKQGMKWLDKHIDEFDQVVWWVNKDNVGSVKLAKSLGFKLDESSVLPDDPWIKYQYAK